MNITWGYLQTNGIFQRGLFCEQQNGPSEEPFWLLFFFLSDITPQHKYNINITLGVSRDLVKPMLTRVNNHNTLLKKPLNPQ